MSAMSFNDTTCPLVISGFAVVLSKTGNYIDVQISRTVIMQYRQKVIKNAISQRGRSLGQYDGVYSLHKLIE